MNLKMCPWVNFVFLFTEVSFKCFFPLSLSFNFDQNGMNVVNTI